MPEELQRKFLFIYRLCLLLRLKGRKTVTAHDMQKAVTEIFPSDGNLSETSILKGTKAVLRCFPDISLACTAPFTSLFKKADKGEMLRPASKNSSDSQFAEYFDTDSEPEEDDTIEDKNDDKNGKFDDTPSVDLYLFSFNVLVFPVGK